MGASIVSLRAGDDRNADEARTIAHLETSSAATVLPAAREAGSGQTNGYAAKAEPNEPIKPYPMRIVRVRPAKNSSPLAAVPLGRTAPAEPALVPPVSAEVTPVENGEGAASPAAPARVAPSAATSQRPAEAKKHQEIARTQTRQRNDDDDDHDRRASYWAGRGEYRAQAYGRPRSWGWF